MPWSGPSAMDQGAELFLAQDYAAAEQAYRLAERSPAWAEHARFMRARCLADLGRWQGCLALLPEQDKAQTTLLKAEALQALGLTPSAAAAYVTATVLCQGTPLAALAAFRAGLFFEQQGCVQDADFFLQRAQRADNSFTQVNRLLADIYSQQGRVSEAKRRLERARRTDPHDAALRQALDELMASHPWIEKRDQAAQKKDLRGRLKAPNTEAAPLPGAERSPEMRVGLLTHSLGFKFKLGPAMELCRPEDGAEQGCGHAFLPAGSAWELKRAGQSWRLRRLGQNLGMPRKVVLSGPLVLRPWEAGGSFRVFDVDYGSGYFFAGREDRSFRGGLELDPEPEGVTVVNLLGLEEYLAGVVPSEIPASWPMEALKAQAIVARTDALNKLGRHRKEGFDVCPEVHCAAYRGLTSENPRTSEAVLATRGMVLAQGKGGKLAMAVYMDNCGGHTWSPEEAWGTGPKPKSGGVSDLIHPSQDPVRGSQSLVDFLDSTPQAWCADGGPLSNSRWVLRYEAAELGRLVARKRPGLGSLSAVSPMERSPSGYLRGLSLRGATDDAVVRGDTLRATVRGIKSNFFYVETRFSPEGQPLEFLFHGGGWGHGAGFCQQGAAGRAKAGQSASQIVRAYFPQAQLTQRY